MSLTTTISRKTRDQDEERPLPPLYPGDHLTREEFEQRYSAYPNLKKAELIEGVVYIPVPAGGSPVTIQHGQIHARVITWLGIYHANTAGLHLATTTTVKFDTKNEVQPDAILYLAPERGGQAKIKEGNLTGALELIVEVATSDAAYDLREKFSLYEYHRVQEHLVLLAYEQQTLWFQLVEGRFEELAQDEDGVLRSQRFPGSTFTPAASGPMT